MLKLTPAIASACYEVCRVMVTKDSKGLVEFILLYVAMGGKVST